MFVMRVFGCAMFGGMLTLGVQLSRNLGGKVVHDLLILEWDLQVDPLE